MTIFLCGIAGGMLALGAVLDIDELCWGAAILAAFGIGLAL